MKELNSIKGVLQIDLAALADSMDAETKLALCKHILIDNEQLRLLEEYLCGRDADGWWTGADANIRQRILVALEDAQLASVSGVRYSWRSFEEVIGAVKDIRCKQHIYWWLHQGVNDSLRGVIWKEMQCAGIKSNYTTEEADADIEKIVEIVKQALNALEKK